MGTSSGDTSLRLKVVALEAVLVRILASDNVSYVYSTWSMVRELEPGVLGEGCVVILTACVMLIRLRHAQ